MDNPETQATLSTRHRGKTNKMKKMSSIDAPTPATKTTLKVY
jgi:hypothetical protein